MVNTMSHRLIEGFGEGARAQISSNIGDSTLFGNNNNQGQVMAANAFTSSGYQSQFNNILSPTTPQQYQQMTHTNHNHNQRYNPHQSQSQLRQPDFSPHIQQQFLRYENQLEMERRRNRALEQKLGLGSQSMSTSMSTSSKNGLFGPIVYVAEGIFRFVLAILNLLLGWLF